MARIAICGEVYSQNLGDGVIAESLAWLLNQVETNVSVSFVDISGRTGFNINNHSCTTKQNWIRMIHNSFSLISLYRRGIIIPIWYFSKRKRLCQLWREKFSDCDLILVGGGQLLMDNNLNFPFKVRELVRVAHSINKDIAFYSCGVGRKWSWLGYRLLVGALFDTGVRWISVRDNGSHDTLRTFFPNGKFESNISIDPAVVTAEAFKINADSKSNIIGLSISAPSTLIRHGCGGKHDFSVKRVTQFWIDLAQLLISDKRQFVFFTNGQADDYEFAKSIVAILSKKISRQNVILLERAYNPHVLITQIAKCQAIVAHRLHANIIAYSLGIPSIGLIWDKKVEEFGKITGRSRYYIDSTHVDPYIVKQCLYDAINDGIDVSRLAEHKASVLQNVKTMLVSTGIRN